MLRDRRRQLALSQQLLAERSRVGIATIKRIESSDETHNHRFLSASRLAEALDVHIDDLAEDHLKRVIDIGEDIELHLTGHTDAKDFRRASNYIADLWEIRDRARGDRTS